MTARPSNTGVSRPEIFTVGHSTRSLEEFISLLQAYGIRRLADIRSLPGSNRVPQFNQENLGPALEAAGIAYVHLKKLGGLRHAARDSSNQGWRNKSFRGFADYMQTPDFAEGLEQLTAEAAARTVMMCAEAVPWRCHRSLVADALLVRGYPVTDIFTTRKSEPHTLTSFAHVEGLKITYPGADPEKSP